MNIPILMGLVAAMAHVISGPDHLAAVTPLVFDTHKRQWRIGLFWGIGHVIGMLLIGVLFYFFKDLIPVERISKYSEQFVGIILIGIGLWAFYRIKHRKKTHRHPHFHPEDELVHIHHHSHDTITHSHEHTAPVSENLFTALTVGIIHGFAGIAHFVLLLPVLGFQSKVDSVSYMLGFAIGIIAAMILYTAVISKMTRNKPTKKALPFYMNFQFWSGVLAIGVGIFWILSN